jgi:hypothetical protein
MANATGEAKSGPLRLGFDSSVQLLFRGSAISSEGGLLLHRELDDALIAGCPEVTKRTAIILGHGSAFSAAVKWTCHAKVPVSQLMLGNLSLESQGAFAAKG